MKIADKDVPTWAIAAAAGTASALLLRKALSNKATKVPKGSEEPTRESDVDTYDVIIVGAGPAGSTCAYYLGDANKGLKILLLERKTFPRVKYCGDAWCSQALDILEDMQYNTGKETTNVLKYLEDNNLCRAVQRGGFVSPFGYECINNEGATYGTVKQIRTYSIKRVIVDEIVARTAGQRPGVELRENADVQVKGVKFDAAAKQWEVPIQHSETKAEYKVKGRLLVAADGATSYLARQLELVFRDADAVSSHRYVVGKADAPNKQHNFKADGVMFYNKATLPGYTALFKHYNNDMYLGTYLLPGSKATARAIAGFEEELVNKHPFVREIFGGEEKDTEENIYEKTQWRSDMAQGENGKMKTAPIRCGGEKISFADHCVVIGDAAGQTDPLTGEGIHTTMVASKIAAETILEMFEAHNFSEVATQVYHERCMQAFGYDFKWSSLAGTWINRFPILLDAACAYGQEMGGQAFLDEFGLLMTGVKAKSGFLQPKLAVPITFYLMREIVSQKILRRSPIVPQGIGEEVVDKYYALSQKKK